MSVRGTHATAHVCAALPFVGDKYHAPRTSRLIIGVPWLGRRMWVEGGGEEAKSGREPIKYHICIKMPSLGSQHKPCYFRDAYLKAVEVWALHAGIAPYTISIIYGPHLYFTGLSGWGWGGHGSHHRCLNNMCLMMSQAWEGEGCDEEQSKRLKCVVEGRWGPGGEERCEGRRWHYNMGVQWSFTP